MQDLAEQAKNGLALGQDRQGIVADVPFAVALADLAQVFGERSQAAVIKFGRVVDDEHDTTLLQEQVDGALDVGLQDTLVSDGGAFHEVITPTQRVGVLALLGQRAPGVSGKAVG